MDVRIYGRGDADAPGAPAEPAKLCLAAAMLIALRGAAAADAVLVRAVRQQREDRLRDGVKLKVPGQPCQRPAAAAVRGLLSKIRVWTKMVGAEANMVLSMEMVPDKGSAGKPDVGVNFSRTALIRDR